MGRHSFRVKCANGILVRIRLNTKLAVEVTKKTGYSSSGQARQLGMHPSNTLLTYGSGFPIVGSRQIGRKNREIKQRGLKANKSDSAADPGARRGFHRNNTGEREVGRGDGEVETSVGVFSFGIPKVEMMFARMGSEREEGRVEGRSPSASEAEEVVGRESKEEFRETNMRFGSERVEGNSFKPNHN